MNPFAERPSESSSPAPGSNARPAAPQALPAALNCWYLTGPTAAGKTRVGIELARLLDAEIISLDSMAVYRGMDIGTAKPTPTQRQAVPHHLVDILDPTEEFSVSAYAAKAHDLIAQIHARGHQALFVGGTPMYLKGLLRGIHPGPPADWEFRAEVEQEARRVGVEALHERLRMVDPLSAEKLHKNDVRRIIRALEVYKLTGEPISHQQMQFDEGTPGERCRVFVLGWARAALHRRIDARVRWMFEEGLVDEVQRLLEQYGALGRTAAQAVGYREVLDFLRGQGSREEMRSRVQIRTHQFARRQETWFRSLCECRRIDQDEQSEAAATADHIMRLGQTVA